MSDLTPLTREEYYLARMAGEDVEVPDPITREEEYMKGIADAINGDDDVEIPEPNTREEEYLKAVTEKLVDATSDLVEKTVTTNGVYKATDDDADGYSEVTVNVSSGGDIDALIDRSITSISSDATSIGQNAFYSCRALTTADVPKATSIGSNAFYSCRALTTADFPKATSIESSAFYNCLQLTTADFPKATSIETEAFRDCPVLKTADFPKAIIIGQKAFHGCRALTSFEVASTVINIGTQAFYNCTSLATITMRPTTPPTLANVNAFTGLPNDYVIYVPNGSLSAYQSAAKWGDLASHMVEMEAE